MSNSYDNYWNDNDPDGGRGIYRLPIPRRAIPGKPSEALSDRALRKIAMDYYRTRIAEIGSGKCSADFWEVARLNRIMGVLLDEELKDLHARQFKEAAE